MRINIKQVFGMNSSVAFTGDRPRHVTFIGWGATAVVFAAIGAILLVAAHAATGSNSTIPISLASVPPQGNAKTVSDSGAIGGSAIEFGSGSTSSGGGSGSGGSSNSGFITASGVNLMQNGKVYKSVSFNFSPVGSCWSSNWTTAQMDQFFAAIPSNSIARFFAPPGGTDSASFVQSIVKEADKYNVHLLISLAVADVYGQCDAADSDSTPTGKTAAYYTNAVKSGSPYANWVKSVVTPLANDPGVAMWEIINEPWHNQNSPLSSVGGASGAATYTNAAAKLIRDAETAGAGSPKQLITLGPADIGETGGVSGMEQIFKNIDVVDDHDYSGDQGGPTAYDNSEFPSLQQIAKVLNKPYMVDETGVEAGSNCNPSKLQGDWETSNSNTGGLTLQNRKSFLLDHKATDYLNAGASYVGLWLYTAPGQEQSGCTYENINPSDPLMAAVKSYQIP